jgi:hypothetical protein
MHTDTQPDSFGPGDRVLLMVPGVITYVPADGSSALVDWPDTPYGHLVGYVPLAHLAFAPAPPAADPELVAGMVVVSVDPADDRRWGYFPADADDRAPFVGQCGDGPGRWWFSRDDLPSHIRPVFDPREASS